ncbi:MAG: 1-acyl-sn-glycerol-3-phosphate acyltransferase [Chloroflexi bacterium]|nr:1-acyl-sn-glycerol-3-phosphate acyltransferase [Chloroflexota bacterium]
MRNKENRAYGLIWVFVGFLWSVLVRWKVRGRRHTPASGAVLVIANHTSNLDPLLVGLAVPRWVRFLSKEEIFHWPVVGELARLFRVIPIDREKKDHRAMRLSLGVLKDGGVLCLFPEGHRSRTGQLLRGQPGAALIAARTGATILPLGIAGGREGLLGKPVPLLGRKISVCIGEPFHLPKVQGRLDRETAQQLADEMMMKIAELLPPEKRGVYAVDIGSVRIAPV